MFSRIRKRLTYANVAMTLALVFAMSGGAYAAKKYLITSTKQIKPSVLAQLKGASGKNGAAGLAGTAGPTGPTGPAGLGGAKGETGTAGAKGEAGAAGAKGETGANGTSVTSKKVEPGEAACNKEGGSEFTSTSGKTTACNGKTGPAGPEGVCSTAGCTLPPGVTEKGEWNVNYPLVNAEEVVYASISFTVPLKTALAEARVHFIEAGEGEGELTPAPAITAHECEGTYKEPKAASGNLCAFSFPGMSALEFNIHGVVNAELKEGTDRAGAHVELVTKNASSFSALGDWAVTG
jgi:Collagen triple helix repeat (20 copies)